jgi:hypothetical protein
MMRSKRISYAKYLDLGGSTNPSVYRKRARNGEPRYYAIY